MVPGDSGVTLQVSRPEPGGRGDVPGPRRHRPGRRQVVGAPGRAAAGRAGPLLGPAPRHRRDLAPDAHAHAAAAGARRPGRAHGRPDHAAPGLVLPHRPRPVPGRPAGRAHHVGPGRTRTAVQAARASASTPARTPRRRPDRAADRARSTPWTDRPTVDLNADLGEGFGQWRLTDDEALLDTVTSANVACGFHAGDPSTMRRVCEAAAGPRREHRRARRLPRPGRLRAPLRRRGARRAPRRRRLPAGRPRGHGRLGRRPGPLRQAARGAVQRDRAPPRAGRRRGRGRRGRRPRRCRWSGCRARSCSTWRPRPGSRRSPRPSPTGPTRPRARWSAAGCPGRCCTTSTTSSPGAWPWPPAARSTDVDGAPLRVSARSLCVHGDTPGAVAVARAVRAGLEGAGVRVAALRGRA